MLSMVATRRSAFSRRREFRCSRHVPGQKGGDEGAFIGDGRSLGIQPPDRAIVSGGLGVPSVVERSASCQELAVGRNAYTLDRRHGRHGRRGAGCQGRNHGRRYKASGDPSESLVSPTIHGAGVHLFAPPGKSAYMFG